MPVFRFISEKLNLLIQKLPFAKGSFFRHVFILSGASALAQLINIASMPILSRLYSPEDFGVLALFTSVVGMFATVSGFRYYLVLPLARRERYVHAVVWLSVLLQTACVVIIVLLAAVLGRYAEGTPYSALLPYRYLIPVGVFCIGMYSMAVQWGIREKYFTLIAKTKLSQTVAACAINLVGAAFGLRPLGLLLGNIAGQSCGMSVLMRALLQARKIKFDITRIRRVAIYYRKMCIFDTPGAVLNMAGVYLLPLLIAFYFSPSVVGALSMAQNALILPSSIVGTAIGQVFTQKAAEARYDGSLASLTARTFELLAKIGVFPILLASFLAPQLFPVILGEKWEEAGRLASLLGPWIAVNFIYSPISALYTTLMLQRAGLIFVSVYTAVRLGSVMLGANSPHFAVFLLSLSGTLMLLIGLFFLLFQTKVDNIFKLYSAISLEVFLEIAPLIFIRLAGCSSVLYTGIAVVISCAVYLTFLLKSSRKY